MLLSLKAVQVITCTKIKKKKLRSKEEPNQPRNDYIIQNGFFHVLVLGSLCGKHEIVGNFATFGGAIALNK